MRNWRVLTAIAAVVLAALAGVLVWKYTQNAKDDAKKPYQLASVLVATGRIPTGTSFSAALDANQIRREDRVRNDLPDTAVQGEANDTQLKTQYGTLVASHDLIAGQTVVSEDFVGQTQLQSGLTGPLSTDQAKDKNKELMAVSVSLDDPHAVGGFLMPGDSVNLIFAGKISDATNPGTGVETSSFLLPGVKILAVGATTSVPQQASTTPTTTEGSVSTRARSLITFEVTPRQALQIVQAQQAGAIYLTLNPSPFKPGDFKDTAEVVEVINLFDKPLPVVDQALARIKASTGNK